MFRAGIDNLNFTETKIVKNVLSTFENSDKRSLTCL